MVQAPQPISLWKEPDIEDEKQFFFETAHQPADILGK